MKKLPIFYNALMLTGVNLLLRVVSTSFQDFISGRIGAAGVGLLQLVLSVASMALTAGIAGIRTATMYLTAEQIGRKKPGNLIWVLSACFLYSILCSGIISSGLYFLAPRIATDWIGNPETIEAIRIYAAFLPIYCLCGVMTGYFTAANRIGTLAAVEVAEQLLSLVLTISLLLFYAGTDPVRACQCVILGSGIGNLLTLGCLVVLRIRERVKSSPRIPVGRNLLGVAVPLALADDLKAGISTTENLMVPKRLALFRGIQNPLAAFGVVCGMVFPILMFPAAIIYGLAELLIPELARCNAAGSTTRIQYLVKRSLKVTFLYGCVFCGLEFLLAENLCLSLYHNSEAGYHLRLYALMIPMLYCDAITDAMVKGLGQQKYSVRYNILTSSMDVAFLFLLLPRFGMAGYLLSFFVTHLVNFILSLRRLIKISGVSFSLKLPFLAGLATVLAVLPALQLSLSIVSGGAFLIILGCVLLLFGVVGKEDVHWLKGLLLRTHVG